MHFTVRSTSEHLEFIKTSKTETIYTISIRKFNNTKNFSSLFQGFTATEIYNDILSSYTQAK